MKIIGDGTTASTIMQTVADYILAHVFGFVDDGFL
jgi:hypothetical protein